MGLTMCSWRSLSVAQVNVGHWRTTLKSKPWFTSNVATGVTCFPSSHQQRGCCHLPKMGGLMCFSSYPSERKNIYIVDKCSPHLVMFKLMIDTRGQEPTRTKNNNSNLITTRTTNYDNNDKPQQPTNINSIIHQMSGFHRLQVPIHLDLPLTQ